MALAADLRARRELPPKLTCAAVMATMASAPEVRPLSPTARKVAEPLGCRDVSA